MVVIAIIGTLSAVATVMYGSYQASAKRTAAKNTMQQISLGQIEYVSSYGTCLLYTSPSPRDPE